MGKINLPNVTVIAIAGNKQGETLAAMYKTLKQITPAKAILITNIGITATGIEVVNVGGLKTWEDYNLFCIKELSKYFDTSHCLVIQWDGYVLDGELWNDKFLEYDYIGAKWLDIGKPYNVGNGGFSLRSKKLQNILWSDDFISTTCPEDVSICRLYGQYLIDKYDIKFAPEDIADKFSFELNMPLHKTFGYHGFHHEPYKETVVVKRNYASGDVLMVEPILHHFYKKGFRVVLDTQPQNYNFFLQHYFPVIPKPHLPLELPYREIDLDKSYEVFPQQNHLKTYYDFAQVPEEERVMRNPILSLNFNYKDRQHKLFKKYCVIHNDVRNEPHRNPVGIDWMVVTYWLQVRGYTVIQIGVGEHADIEGAVFMRTPTEPFLMWVIASANLFIGIDSLPSHIASAFAIPSVILFGSVNPELIHPDPKTNKVCLHNHEEKRCDTPFCWHLNDVGSETGIDCVVDKENPPCMKFTAEQVIGAVESLHNRQKLKSAINI